jgi:hypothetical protein
MQQRRETAEGFRAVHLDAWAPTVTLSFGACYDACLRAYRTLIPVPDPHGQPLYLIIRDTVVPTVRGSTTFGLLFHTDPLNRVELLSREAVNIVGGRAGNHCRVITTANRPGRYMVDQFLGHPRLRYQNQGSSLEALSLFIPYCAGEKLPLFERSAADNDAGFVARLRHRGVEDLLALCVEGAVGDWGIETDASLALVREGDRTPIIALDATFIKKEGAYLFQAATRSDYFGPARGSED